MTEIYGLLIHKPPQFRSTQTKRGIFLCGIKSSLSIVTLTDTHVGSKTLSKYDFILTTSIETTESKFLKHGCLRSESITAVQLQSGPVREHHLLIGIIRIEIHQSQRTNVHKLLHVNNRPHRLMKTSSIAVETSRSISQSDSIVRQRNKRSFLSDTTMNNIHIFNDKSVSVFVIYHTSFQAFKNIVTNVMLYVCNNLYFLFHRPPQFSLEPAHIYKNFERT